MNNYIVMQGHTYLEEMELGIIWSAQKGKGGTVPHSWHRMKEVQKGDRIFHYVKGLIVAISVTTDNYQTAPKPSILQNHRNWDDEGFLVNLEYHELDVPLNVRASFNEILPLLPIKY